MQVCQCIKIKVRKVTQEIKGRKRDDKNFQDNERQEFVKSGFEVCDADVKLFVLRLWRLLTPQAVVFCCKSGAYKCLRQCFQLISPQRLEVSAKPFDRTRKAPQA